MSRLRQLLAALGIALACVVLGDAASWAAPAPAPYPTPGNAVPGAWSCTSTITATPVASVWPSPVPAGPLGIPAATTSPKPTTSPSPVPGQDCAVTTWVVASPPAAVVVPTPTVYLSAAPVLMPPCPAVTSSPSASPSPAPTPGTRGVDCALLASVDTATANPFLFGLAILVVLAVASFVYRHGTPLRGLGRWSR